MSERPRVELLAPAGGPPALRAALTAGADAVYLGLDRWSARAFAANFAARDLPAAIDQAHRYGARACLALNVSLKDDEIEPALAALAEPYRVGLDAAIVADLGFAALVRELYPDLELHASTQLNTHSSAQLALLSKVGVARAILARELSLDEIRRLETHGVELEAFVHGALCYGYSGLCLLSSMAGGRSGNRGRCSQACRLHYQLASAGDRSPRPSRLLSTADLAAISALPALIAAGVRAFKIEGRMKDAHYVAVTTSVYREALTVALADPEGYEVRPEWLARLEQSFSRGFTTAHLDGRHSEVRSGGRGGHRGVLVGRVQAVDEGSGEVTVRLSTPLADDDVVHVYTPWGGSEPVRVAGALVRRSRDGGSIVLRLRERVAVKDRVFRLRLAVAEVEAAALTAGRQPARPLPLRARLRGGTGRALTLTLAGDGEEVTAVSASPLQPAQRAALTEDKARAALAALGGTPYELAGLEYAVEDGVFVPVAELKELRRRAVAGLDERRLARARRAAPAPAAARRAAPPARRSRAPEEPYVVLRIAADEAPATLVGVCAACLDLTGDEDADRLAAAVDRLRRSGLDVRCRPPEILFDDDRAWWSQVAALGWDAVYARHALTLETRAPVIVEYPLQGLNAETPGVLGAAGVVCSPEATLDEIGAAAARLAAAPPSPFLEILAFGRQQVLVTRDRLGEVEGVLPTVGSDTAAASPGGPAPAAVALELTDAKDYRFAVTVTASATRIGNARVTNLARRRDDLLAAGVGGFIVVQRDLDESERAEFCACGLAGLAALYDRERHTGGHLHRGVA